MTRLISPPVTCKFSSESGRGDLNPRPPAPKAGALPGCATPRIFSGLTWTSPLRPELLPPVHSTRAHIIRAGGKEETKREQRRRPRQAGEILRAPSRGGEYVPQAHRTLVEGVTAPRRTKPPREELLGPLDRRPGADRVVDEHEPHRPVPRSWLGKLVPGPEEPRQGHGGGGEPDDHPDGQDPQRGSHRHHDEARDGAAEPDVANSERPDSRPPRVRCVAARAARPRPALFHRYGTGSLVLLVVLCVTD